ncbi:MAG: SIS domain-containing protein [Anaerolineaceae bacterium]|jgi:uncharacterized phosphosugar-binding protein
MSTLSVGYINTLIELLGRIRDEEMPALEKAAKLIADAIENGKSIFGFGCTHSSLPIQDLVYRAGGLILINPIYGPGIASLDVKPARLTSAIERLSGYAQLLLDNHPIAAGDVLILVSVSGRNAVPVEMAKIASERGIIVIGVTSYEYSENVTSRHPSGKKMYQFADVVIDNKVPKGDAVVGIDGFPVKFTPASGVTSVAVLHALVTLVIEQLHQRGITPPVAIAANVDGSDEHNARIWAQYKDRIHYL